MAKNGPKGGGREGAITGRSQFINPKTGLSSKRDTANGRIMDNKTSGGDFKGVRHEKSGNVIIRKPIISKGSK